MSKSNRFFVRESSDRGWFHVVDGKDGAIVAEIKGRSEAFARARGLNRAEDAKPKPSPKPSGYISVECAMCPAALFILPGGSTVCPKCRAECEAIIEFNETREAQLKAAEEELMEASYRRVLVGAYPD